MPESVARMSQRVRASRGPMTGSARCGMGLRLIPDVALRAHPGYSASNYPGRPASGRGNRRPASS